MSLLSHLGLARSVSSRMASLSRAFHSIVYKEHGDPTKVLAIHEAPDSDAGQPGEGQVLAELVGAPLNPSDLNQIEGVYPIKAVSGLPAVAGNEGAFRVRQVGPGVAGLSPGDKVVVMEAGYGTWSSLRVFPSDVLYRVPDSVSDEMAATLCINPVSAFRMLADFEDLKPGDTVIQNGANSAVGQCVIQLARARGLKTINLVRDRPDLAELTQHLKSLGADVVTTEAKLKQDIKGLPAPRLGLNCVGGAIGAAVARSLAPGGTMVTYGGMSRELTSAPASLFIFKDITLRGFWLSGRWHKEHGLKGRADTLGELVQLVQAGKLVAPKSEPVGLRGFAGAVERAAQKAGMVQTKFIFTP